MSAARVSAAVWGLVITVCVSAFVCAEEVAVTLVDDRVADSVIIVPANASVISMKAASELRRGAAKMTGAQMTIYAEDELALEHDLLWIQSDVGLVYVGPTDATRKAFPEVEDLEPEAYIVRTAPNRLYLSVKDRRYRDIDRTTKFQSWEMHSHDRGTLYAVHDLLRTQFGVRWLWPGDLGEVMPERRTLAVPQTQKIGRPAYPVRQLTAMGGAGTYRYGYWTVGFSPAQYREKWTQVDRWLERAGCGQSIFFGGSGLFFADRFVDRYAESHPEWFALQDDGTRATKPYHKNRPRVCLANPELAGEVARVAVDWLRSHPDYTGYSIGLSDASPETFCTCDLCRAWGDSSSHREVRFYSKVADLVAKELPGKLVTGYNYYSPMPLPSVLPLSDNLLVKFVTGGRDPKWGREIALSGYLRSGDRALIQESFRAWAGAARKVAWRQDYDHALGLPINYLPRLAEDLNAAADSGHLKGSIFTEGVYNNWASMGIVYYALATFFREGRIDADALLADYCRSGFGNATSSVMDYFKELERITNLIGERNDISWRWRDGVLKTAVGFYPQRIARLNAILKDARKLADDDRKALERIEFLQTSLDYAKLQLEIWKLYFTETLSDREKAGARELMEKRLAFFKDNRASFAVSGGWVVAKEGKDENSPLVKKFGWKYPE